MFNVWGLGIGDWVFGPIPNPQSPIPKINNKVVKIKNNYKTNSYNNKLYFYIIY